MRTYTIVIAGMALTLPKTLKRNTPITCSLPLSAPLLPPLHSSHLRASSPPDQGHLVPGEGRPHSAKSSWRHGGHFPLEQENPLEG